jgi:hypothetical protein
MVNAATSRATSRDTERLDFGHKIIPMKFAPLSIAARASSTDVIPHTFTNGVAADASRPARVVVVVARRSEEIRRCILRPLVARPPGVARATDAAAHIIARLFAFSFTPRSFRASACDDVTHSFTPSRILCLWIT